MHAIINQKALDRHTKLLLKGLVQICPADSKDLRDTADTDCVRVMGFDVRDRVCHINLGLLRFPFGSVQRKKLPSVLNQAADDPQQAGFTEQCVRVREFMQIENFLNVTENRLQVRCVQHINPRVKSAGR